jgi:serine/threonine protein kinase
MMLIISDTFLKQQPLAEGGEGIIHMYQDKILKVYKPVVNKKEKFEKVSRLLNKQLPPTVIKPVELAYNERKEFIGYLMDKVDGEELKRLSNKKFVKANNVSVEDIVNILNKIKDTLVDLHKTNVVVGDLNDCNILITTSGDVFFIDVDSWSVDGINCSVCMDTFKDPLLVADNFTPETDAYAFGILAFKTLTKVHPFGGTTIPDLDLLERMKKRMSVIKNPNVVIPRTIEKWDFVYPKIIDEIKDIMDDGKRFLINDSLKHFKENLKYCPDHKDFYYSKFNSCPVCNANAQVQHVPIKSASINGIPYIILFDLKDIDTILNKDIYLSTTGEIVHLMSKRRTPTTPGMKYYFSNDGEILYAASDVKISVHGQRNSHNFEKQFKGEIVVHDNRLYYTNTSNTLVEVIVNPQGNAIRNISKVSINNVFDIIDKDKYLICNIYDNMKIVNIDGYNHTINDGYKIQEYGIHYDEVSKHWLFITEDHKGIFRTYVFDKNKLVYFSDTIRYKTDLNNVCFNGNGIFVPGDKVIKGFSYQKNIYKDFECDVVNEESKLLKKADKFIAINSDCIYRIG